LKPIPQLSFLENHPIRITFFYFPDTSLFQLITFVQKITLKVISLTSGSRCDGEVREWLDYIYDSFNSNRSTYRPIEIPIESGKLSIPQGFETSRSSSQNPVIVNPNLHILAQFEVHTDAYMTNPVKETEISDFTEFSALREAIEVRGLEPSMRWKVWPILLNVLPFKSDQSELLALRVDEYRSIRDQWQTRSKAQIKYNQFVREAFITIQVDVKRTNPPLSVEQLTEWRIYLIRILRTYAVWNLDVRYTQGFNDILSF
jgi:hypothetical protein